MAATDVAVRAAPRAQALGEPQARLLQRLGVRSAHWVETVTHYRRHFFTMVGTVQRMALYCTRIDRDRAKGTGWAKKVFRPAAWVPVPYQLAAVEHGARWARASGPAGCLRSRKRGARARVRNSSDTNHGCLNTPWVSQYPNTQHLNTAALMQAGRPDEAEAVYRAALDRVPDGGWALFGLASSLAAQGKTAEAATVEARFRKVWSKADVQITSSCLCQPGA